VSVLIEPLDTDIALESADSSSGGVVCYEAMRSTLAVTKMPAKSYILSLMAGVCLGLPWVVDGLGPLGSVGWVLLLRHAASGNQRSSVRFCSISGAIQFVVAFHWAPHSIFETTYLPMWLSWIVFAVLVIWETVPYAIFGWWASRLRDGGILVWFQVVPLWVSLENIWPKIFPWSISHTYLEWGSILQVAEFAGTGGVAALIMTLNINLFLLTRIGDRSMRETRISPCKLIAVTCLTATCITWGCLRYHQVEAAATRGSGMRVGIVQSDPTLEGSIEKLRLLSDGIQSNVDLIVWPESSIGIYDSRLEDFRDENKTVEWSEAPNPAADPYPDIRTWLLAGGKTYDNGGRNCGPYRNVGFLIDSDKQIRGRTCKRTLMPMGEYAPGERWFPQLRRWAAIDMEIVRGSDDAPLSVKTKRSTKESGSESRTRLARGLPDLAPTIPMTQTSGTMPLVEVVSDRPVGVLICYEDMDHRVAASTVRLGAECLVAMINASAFTSTTTRSQHLKLAQLRAVENRRSFLRCGGTGVSCYISPSGRIIDALPMDSDGVLVADVALNQKLTFFTVHGPWFTQGCWLLTSLIILCPILPGGSFFGLPPQWKLSASKTG
jgi:apolipoprotein N-acyltransferase